MQKSFDEINEKIQSGKVVVVTAEEVVAMAAEQGVEKTARQVDVVTCATFGAMCSSGAFINFGHSDEPIRMAKVSLNDGKFYGDQGKGCLRLVDGCFWDDKDSFAAMDRMAAAFRKLAAQKWLL